MSEFQSLLQESEKLVESDKGKSLNTTTRTFVSLIKILAFVHEKHNDFIPHL